MTLTEAVYKGMIYAAIGASAVTWFCLFMFLVSGVSLWIVGTLRFLFRGNRH